MFRGRHGSQKLDGRAFASGFVVAKKERPVLDDRTSDGNSELVALVEALFDGAAVVLPGIRVEVVVAQELVDDAVERIGARLGDEIHHPSRGTAILG